MGGRQSSPGEDSIIKDDATQSTRSSRSTTKLPTKKQPKRRRRQKESLAETTTKPTTTGVRINRSRPTSDLFHLHGLAVESFDTRSLSWVIGSMMDSNNSVNSRISRTTSAPIQVRVNPNDEEGDCAVAEAPPHAYSMLGPASVVDFREISRLVEHDDESLPRPFHEKELKVAEYIRRKATTSSPMQCPPQGTTDPTHIAHSAGEAEYLSRLYNLRTWNMYRLIKETRHNDSLVSQQLPRTLNHPTPQLKTETPSESDMVFDMDFD